MVLYTRATSKEKLAQVSTPILDFFKVKNFALDVANSSLERQKKKK
jgi:hypothetical protein